MRGEKRIRFPLENYSGGLDYLLDVLAYLGEVVGKGFLVAVVDDLDEVL